MDRDLGRQDETQNQRSKNADMNVIFCCLWKYTYLTAISIKETAQIWGGGQIKPISLARKVKDEGSSSEDKNVYLERYDSFL